MFPANLLIITDPLKANNLTKIFRQKGIMRHLVLVSALLGVLLLSITSCDSNGLVGSSIVDDPSDVASDTLHISNSALQDIRSFSGGKSNMTAGWYNDALFGELKFTALLQPSINRSNVDTISEQATAMLTFPVSSHYGDLDGTTEFEIVELNRRWRANAWRVDSIPDLSSRVIGSFTATGQDSVETQLDQQWLQEYRSYFYNEVNRDSTYRDSFYGFAIVPRNVSRFMTIPVQNIRMVIDNHDGSDTTYAQTFRAWGYSKEHIEPDQEYSETSYPVFNNFKNNLVFSFNFQDEYDVSGDISRAELVIYQDTTAMQETLPAGHQRNTTSLMNIYLLREDQTQVAVTGDATFSAARRASDGSWRFNITNYLRGQIGQEPDTRKFYVKIGADNGSFVPYYIHNHLSDTRNPKILITRVSPSGN